MKLSYVIVTHNRKEALLRTLRILHTTTPLASTQWEAWVVDNGSTDGTIDALRQSFPRVNVIARERNEGVWARSYAFGRAAGDYVIMLDDDSYPMADAAIRSMDYLDENPRCGAVVGRVLLPDGSAEACALPAVMLSGAVCVRRSILPKVGGFRKEFFRKAGEYDFSFRIWEAGYTVERFEDILYRHDKVLTSRSQAFAHRMDLRNNLILVERYFPKPLRRIYRKDYRQRYAAIARHQGFQRATRRALREAKVWRVREAASGRQTLSARTLESVLQLDEQARSISVWARQQQLCRVAIVDFSKNLYATYDGCRRAGLRVTAIADENPAFDGLDYRGIPVMNDAAAIATGVDGVVVSNVNPAQVDRVCQRIRQVWRGPTLRLWQPKLMIQRWAVAA